MDRNLRIRMLLEASNKVTKPLRDIAGGSSRAAQALKATRDRLKEIDRAQADIKGFRELKAGLHGTETQLQATQTRVGELARAIASTDSPTKRMMQDFARAKREAAGLKAEAGEQATKLQQLRDRMAAAGIATKDLAAHERRLRGEASRTNEELAEQERRVTQLTDRSKRLGAARAGFDRIQNRATGLAAGGYSAIATGRVAGAPILGSIKSAMEYQSVMTDIAQKADISREDARKMGIGLLAAARAANQMPEALQQGVDALAGFGLDPRQAVQMMRPIGRAATAYKADITDLSKAAFAANDNLKVPIDQTGRMIDVMAQAGKSGAFEIKDMAQYFPALTAAYQGLGQSGLKGVADLAAAAQITRKGAGDSASAADNLLNLLNKINTKEAAANFKKFGVDLPAGLKKAAKDGKGPIEAITELTAQALKGDTGKLSYLFGDMQVQAALRPLMANIGSFRQIRDEALHAQGVTDRDFAERLKDAAEKAKTLQIQSHSLGITMGGILLPVATALMDKAAVLAERFGNWADRNPQLAQGLVVTAAAAAGLMIVFGGIAIAAAGVLAPFAALSFAAGALGLTLGAVLLPVAGVVAAIAGLIAIGVALYNHWGDLQGYAVRVWQGITAAFTGGIGNITATLVNWSPLGLIYRGIAALLGFLGIHVPAQLADVGRNLILGLINGITGMLGALKSAIVNAASAAANWFKSKLGIHSPSRVFMGFGGYMMQGLANGIDGGAPEPVRRIDGLSRKIAAAMAIGAAAPSIAAPGLAGGSGTAGGAPAAAASGGGFAPVTINVYGTKGQSAEDIARAVRDEWGKLQRGQAAAARSRMADDPDWS